MSPYALFRRQPVPQQYEQALQTQAIPVPLRGIVQSENEAFMVPGGAIVQDNWLPTMRGVKLRGGCIRWNDLHGGAPLNDPGRLPIISAFEYASGNVQRMYAAQATNLFDVTAGGAWTLLFSGQNSGNWCASQMSNAQANWMLCVNEAGDYPLRFNGTSWIKLDPALGTPADGASAITGPAGTPVVNGHGLSYVWKYRNHLFFIAAGSMDAYYLPINAVGGALAWIPLSGAATKGGKLLFGATWSVDAGDGIDDKCIFCTDLGEVLIFSGSNPADPSNWRQEGRYAISPPLGMNAHISVGGDLLILTVDGIVPISQAITKDAGQLELAMLTRTIKPLWRDAVNERRSWPWTAKKWDEQGGLLVTTPGGPPGNRFCLVANNVTAAWCRALGYDATCFIRMREALFFGTQAGIVMQAMQGGYDDGLPYVATLVGGWELFGAPTSQIVWHQARASFRSANGQPFQPQLSATVDYDVTVPTPPAAGPDPGVLDVWDQGLWGPDSPWVNAHAYAVGDLAYDGVGGGTIWRVAVAHTSAATGTFAADRTAHPTFWVSVTTPNPAEIAAYAQWDQPSVAQPPVRNTLWVSIGKTGFAHAPIVQVTVAQQAAPDVELIAIGATYERAGVNV